MSTQGHEEVIYYNCWFVDGPPYFQNTTKKVDLCHEKDQTAHRVSWQSAEVLLFLSWGAQLGEQGVDQRVLDVTQNGHWRIHLRQLLDDQNGGEEGGAGATVLGVDLDAHELRKVNTRVIQ